MGRQHPEDDESNDDHIGDTELEEETFPLISVISSFFLVHIS